MKPPKLPPLDFATLDLLQEGVWVVDSTDTLVFVNAAMGRIAGVDAKRMTGRELHSFPEEALKPFLVFFNRAKTSLQACPYECPVAIPAGPKTWQGGWLSPLVDKGRYAGMICTARDITDEKLAAEALSRSSGSFRLALESARAGTWTLDPATGDFRASDRALEIHGLPPGTTLTQETAMASVFPEDRQQIEAAVQRTLATGGTMRLEHRIVWPDGTLRWVEAYALRSSDVGEDLLIGFIRDITELKSLQRQMENELLYRSIIDDQTEVISRFLPDGTFVFVNEVYCRLFGKTAAELIGKQWHPAAHADDLPLIEARLREMSPTNPVVEIENRVYVADGELRWMHFVNRGFYDADGQLKEIQSVGRDITTLTDTERRLASKSARLELALSMANLVAWEINLTTGISRPDPSVEGLLGYTQEEMTKPWAWRPLMDPRDAPRAEGELLAHLKGESEFFHCEYRLRHKRGHWVSVQNRARVVERDSLGKPLRMVGVLRDVTQGKRLNEEGVELLKRIETMIREGTGESPADSAKTKLIDTLTKRERQVLGMIADGMTSAQIGNHLNLSANTINVHRQKLMAKLDLHSTVEATRFAIEHGLIRKH